MKKSLFQFILIVIFLLGALAPNCTKTITEYKTETDTLLVKPMWAIEGTCEWGKLPNGENDYTTVLCWAVMRNITDIDKRHLEIANPRIGILVCDGSQNPWKSFEKGVADNLGVIIQKNPNYTPVTSLQPGEYGYMYEVLTVPKSLGVWISYIGLSDDETPPGNLGKRIAVGMGKLPTEKEIEQIKQKLAQE